VPHERQGEADLESVPWARYEVGQPSLEGWLYAHSHLYRYVGVIGQLLSFQLDVRQLLERTAEEHSVSADGYSALTEPGPFDVSQPPDPKIDHPYIEHYFSAMSPFRLLPENMAALDRILAMSGQPTQVILVEMPIIETYYAFFGNGEADYRQFVAAVRDKAAAHDTSFVRMESLERLPVPDWFNYNHLNRDGAAIFSRWLGTAIGKENKP
jgi:hypothetical protein